VVRELGEGGVGDDWRQKMPLSRAFVLHSPGVGSLRFFFCFYVSPIFPLDFFF